MPPSYRKIKATPSFAAQKHAWIERMTRDPQVSHLQVRLVLLISFHLNKVSGDAWPSQRSLAAALGITTRAVQLNLKALLGLGYLRIQTGGMGPGDTNRYSPMLEDDKGESRFALNDAEWRIPVQAKGESRCKKGRIAIRTNPSKKTLSKRTCESKRTRWPDDFSLTPEMIAIAIKEGFDLNLTHRLFDKFKWFNQSKGNTNADWTAAWRLWVHNQVDFDEKARAKEPPVHNFL